MARPGPGLTMPNLSTRMEYVLLLTGVSMSSTLKPLTRHGSPRALATRAPLPMRDIGGPSLTSALPNGQLGVKMIKSVVRRRQPGGSCIGKGCVYDFYSSFTRD